MMTVLIKSIVITLLSLSWISNIVVGKRVSGTINTKERWAFMARFCFLSTGRGSMYFRFVYPKTYAPETILLYFDSDDQWPAVYKTDTNCSQKVGIFEPTNNQVIKLSEDAKWSGCVDAGSNYECTGGRVFRSSRERWWYMAVSNCDSAKGVEMEYEMNLTNSDPDDFFFYHFSADEFYILQTDIGFVCFYIIMFLLSTYVAFRLRSRQLFHTTYKMYMLSVATQVIELICHCIGYSEYAKYGEEQTLSEMKLVGRIFGSCSILVFLLMLILMGKGYTITRGRLSQSGSIKIAVFMTIYVVVFITLFVYEANFFDPGLVIYLYESPAGYGLIAVRLIGWIWFCYAIFFTLKHYPEKSSFYYPYLIVYTLWFFAMPVLVLAGHFLIPKYMREKVINGIQLSISFLGHSIFLFLTRPSAANSNFPYHVRTTQIGILQPPSESGSESSQSGTAMTDTCDYPSNSYSLPADYEEESGMEKNFSSIFTTQRTTANNNQHNHAKAANVNGFPHYNINSNRFS